MNARDDSRRFLRIATAGVFFQGGGAAVDTRTVVAALVDGLSGGSALAVGAANAISRYGWLFPQIFVGYLAQRRRRRLLFYAVGAYGRVACLVVVAAVLFSADSLSPAVALAGFFGAWTVYGFVSGIVAVPYNDIVARAVPSGRRSRLLALRFFGGGVLALGVASAAGWVIETAPDREAGYAAVVLLGAGLLCVSATAFVSAGEPPAPEPATQGGFRDYLQRGVSVFRDDLAFRRFLYNRWLGGLAAMAQPFYVVQAVQAGVAGAGIAVLLGAQTAGALASNPVWGRWGDRGSKLSLLKGIALLGLVPPTATLGWSLADLTPNAVLPAFVAVFFLLGAIGNGDTIAQLGYLMEISPERERPAYSGYFNALAAPAALLPLLGAGLVDAASYEAVFGMAALAAALQFAALFALQDSYDRGGHP